MVIGLSFIYKHIANISSCFICELIWKESSVQKASVICITSINTSHYLQYKLCIFQKLGSYHIGIRRAAFHAGALLPIAKREVGADMAVAGQGTVAATQAS